MRTSPHRGGYVQEGPKRAPRGVRWREGAFPLCLGQAWQTISKEWASEVDSMSFKQVTSEIKRLSIKGAGRTTDDKKGALKAHAENGLIPELEERLVKAWRGMMGVEG